MKVLVIECTPATPHAETSLEIAIKESLSGSQVIYCPIFHVLPQLFWRSNINGRKQGDKIDSLADWLKYLVSAIGMHAEVDIFELNSTPNYINENIINNPFEFEYEGQPFGALVRANAIELTKNSSLSYILDLHHNLCMSLAQTSILAYELTKMLIAKHQPDRVVFFNGRTPGSFPIYLACKLLGVSTCIHERGPTKYHYTLWANPPMFMYEQQNKMNLFSKSRDSYVSRCSASVFFDRQRSSKLTSFGPLVNKFRDHDVAINVPHLSDSYVVYFASSNWETIWMPTQDFSNGLGDQYQAVANLVKVCDELGIQLVIRMHPNTPKSEWSDYDRFSNDGKCIVIPPDDSASSYRLGVESFRNFSFGSTITWEFMHKGIHCATLGRSLGSGEIGVVELDSVEAIREYIRQDLGLVDNRFSVKFGDFFHNYGERHDFYRPQSLFSGKFNIALDASE